MLGLWPFKTRKPPKPWALSSRLLDWTKGCPWSLRDAVAGCLVLGATGCGKSTGSGRAIAMAMLKAGFGGLVLTAKRDERTTWEWYCRTTGRLGDLETFGADEPLRFNVLDHELNRAGSGAGLTENIVSLLSAILEVADRNCAGGAGRGEEAYWKRANRQLCRNVVDLLVLATGRITIPDMYRAVISAPTSLEQKRSPEWRSESACWQWLSAAEQRPKSARQEADFAIVADYFLIEYPSLSDKTRSVVVSTFTSMIDVLNRGLFRDLFSTETNITPEATTEGKIILVDLPVKEYGEVGQFAQILWKHAFQRAVERRLCDDDTRPVFLWADEAQYFLTSYDMQFLTTCRAAKIATVLLTQNVSNVYAALGAGEKGRAEADSLFANLNTKVLHANGDPVTNEYAASLIGRTRQLMANASNSYSSDDLASMVIGLPGLRSGGGMSSGFSETFEYEVQPHEFTRLRTGGPDYDWCVDGIVFQNGKVFKNGSTWLPVTFRQRD